mmetsp:Transcript_10202/g.9891  ORF Transcript_10202/g.9891 Transcript_10202/m.9891 type:complete len:354 (+) Transcript_10202:138-1199(+)|eukprot:CAMPEP_0119033568 /NCGR_PEP_ID=MMETSP1177-20130426/617_1 /TAXON_ID=2985 /ORGANISM="Ochromonas sp, Strain CCMP1899" /LENGTH=353 /DNA_ID=CAMNT_0006990403 /DNA_START=85 /DNA_END=1146 /DNA_ORIENTATION=+
MTDSNWKNMLKAQQADLDKLEAQDAELNDDKVSLEIEKALKKTKLDSYPSTSSRRSENYTEAAADDYDRDDGDEGTKYRSRPPPPAPSARPTSATSRREVGFSSLPSHSHENDNMRSPIGQMRGRMNEAHDDTEVGGSPGGDTPKAPDATARYQKARLKMLSKQVEDGTELRKQLSETANDLQRQLKNEREENKKSKKRIQLLEVETKRTSNRRISEADANQAADSAESLSQEVALLKKDLQTADRIGKQSEVIAKAKETHLKRALETIARLKSQVSELQSNVQDDNTGERNKLDIAESRIKLLERQRTDLISAFKKQMKLVDVLKRQKVHIEAARLLAFTEDEFLRTLDWGA